MAKSTVINPSMAHLYYQKCSAIYNTCWKCYLLVEMRV